MMLNLTANEAKSLKDKLETLMTEAQGVDIWIAPGGVLNVNEDNRDAECFLDCDEQAHYDLGNILKKLGGTFQSPQD